MSTRIGSQFSDVMARLNTARKLEEKQYKNVAFFGDLTDRKFDLDGDGKADVRTSEATKMGATRREVTFLDAQGRAVDTFTSGTRLDSFFGLVETGKVWSHTHYERDAATGLTTETYERASNKTGELSARATKVFDSTTLRVIKDSEVSDRDDNGTLETSTVYK
jgi:hypothetical protein